MSSRPPSSPSLLEQMLAQDEETRHKRAQRVTLEAPQDAQIEHKLLLALVGDEHLPEENEAPHSEDRGPTWWEWLFSLPLQPAFALTAACVVIGIGSWKLLPQATHTPPHRLLPKGGTQHKQAPVLLQISRWNPTSRRLTPLQKGASIQSSESLVFSVLIRRAKGYLSLLHEDQGQSSQIFPFPGTTASLRRRQKQVQLLQQKGPLQRYTLERAQGPQRFVLLYSKRPLTSQELQRWSRSGQRTSLSTLLIGTDTFTLQVQRRKR